MFSATHETEDCLDQGLQRVQARIKVVALGLGAILAFFAAVGLVLYLKPGGDAPVPDEAVIFVAGPLEEFEPGTASYFRLEHLYVLRMQDGALLALYDLGPRMQARVNRGDETALECRVEFVEDEDNLTRLGDPPPGFEDRVFREPCDGSVWDAAGRHLFGPASGDLDRFPLGVVDGVVRVDVSERRCMNPPGPEAPCLPTR